MATQMSAVTLVGTTGQAYPTGLRFVQFYFGLPLAMVILSLTVVPFFTPRAGLHRVRISRTPLRRARPVADEFPVPRGPGVFARRHPRGAVGGDVGDSLGWTLPVTVLAICMPMVLYTTIGGVQAVAWTDVKQMFVVVFGMLAAVGILLYGIPQHVGFGQALHLAGATGRLKAIDFKFDLRETYTFWSGMHRRICS